MKEFEYYVGKGDVKRQSPDKNLSAATLNEAKERLALAKTLKQIAKAKYVLENAYESMREAADAVLYLRGFKSFSHEASILYLFKEGFNEQDIIEFDRFRRIRNGIKYYGKDCDLSDAEQAIQLASKIIAKIKEEIEFKV